MNGTINEKNTEKGFNSKTEKEKQKDKAKEAVSLSITEIFKCRSRHCLTLKYISSELLLNYFSGNNLA